MSDKIMLHKRTLIESVFDEQKNIRSNIVETLSDPRAIIILINSTLRL